MRRKLTLFRLKAAIGGAAAGILVMAAAIWLVRFGLPWWAAAVGLGGGIGCALTFVGARWHEESITDDGTGLFNRRYIFRRLSREWRLAIREGTSLSVAVLDLDDFRRINSQFGHLAGDAALAAVAKALRGTIRRGDIVGRWGGEEFALVLPGADAAEAVAVAERVRSAIQQLRFQLDGSEGIRVTISAGVAAITDGITLKELVERADRAMYSAKEQKNTVILAP